MKKLLMILLFACLGSVGYSSVAFGGTAAPGECGWSGEMCAGEVEFEVDVVCYGTTNIVGSVVLSDDPYGSFFAAEFDDDDGFVCYVSGYMDQPKTEVKCTAAVNGPGHKSNDEFSAVGPTVEVEMKATDSDACAD